MGCGYIPIDPNLPFERIKFMIDDSNPSLLILNENNNNFNQLISEFSSSTIITTTTGISPKCRFCGTHNTAKCKRNANM